MVGTVFEQFPRSLVRIHLGGVVIVTSDPWKRQRCSLRLWTWSMENSFHFISFYLTLSSHEYNAENKKL